ncbi:altered inheritance of mitochondria protein 32-like [Diospyros lotus]|uniref:altered inheritance of mitochondria protein 32-like n=1 Tax=Diospyros lotus TaxID=55363 RepID=UPI002254E1F9|nr:altered inheritance of mitochondria protein 32-like [Diospyros lotus]
MGIEQQPRRFLITDARAQRYISSLGFFNIFIHSPATAHPFRYRSSPSTTESAMDGDGDGVAENFSSDAIADADVKYGFQRPEMYQSNLVGTVKPYSRHLFLCYKTYESWPSKVEGSESDPLPKLLSGAIKARKNDIDVKTNLTICEGREGTEFLDGDVLIFPEMIKYRGLKDSDVDSFVEDVLVNGKPWTSGVKGMVSGSHVFVCAHASRDRRCGVCGPPLIEKFKEEIEVRGLKDQVFVSACSHVGGHKYAGNLIIFSVNAEQKVAGHWYGYVTPHDVAELMDQHIAKGKIIERLWRGQMGSFEHDDKDDHLKIPNGKNMEETENSKGSDLEKKEYVTSCCQGANGFSCCQDGSLEVKKTTEVEEKKGLGKLSSWVQNLDQSDVLATVAVVGGAATVAVAYSFYRRSG